MNRTNFRTIFQVKLTEINKGDLAKSLYVTRQTIEHWMKGGLPSADKIRRLVQEFGFTYSDFFEYEKDEMLD